MNRVNKILILFLFIIALFFMAIWEVLQSKWVGDQISNLATSYIVEVLDADVEFSNLQFNLFPPGAEVNDVSFNAKKSNFEVSVHAKKLGIYFNPFDVFQTSFVIDNINIEDGEAIVLMKDTKSKTKKENPKNSEKIDIFAMLEDMPINSAGMKDVSISYNNYSLFTSRLLVNNRRDSLEVETKINDINLSELMGKKINLDSVEVKLSVDQEKVDIDKVIVKTHLAQAQVQGTIEAYLSKNIRYNMNYKSLLPINLLHDWFDFKEIGFLDYGILNAEGKIKGKGAKYKITSSAELEQFKTDFIYGEKLKVKAYANEKEVVIEKVELEAKEEQRLVLDEKFLIYDIENSKLLPKPFSVTIDRLQMNNFLSFLQDNLSIIDGVFSGRVLVDIQKTDLSFYALDDVKVHEFKVKLNEKKDIVKLVDLELRQGDFLVKNGVFLMDLKAQAESTELVLDAKIGKEVFELNMPIGRIDLTNIDNIMGLELEGTGNYTFKMYKKNKSLFLDTKQNFKNIKVEGYNVEKVNASIIYNLNEGEINFKNVAASSGKTKSSANGILNYQNMGIDIKYNVRHLNFNEVKKILKPLLKTTTITANEIHGDWNSRGRVTGFMDVDRIKLSGSLTGRNNYIFDENIDFLSANYSIEAGVLNLKNIYAEKSRGRIRGNASYEFLKQKVTSKLKILALPIQDFSYYNKIPLALKAELNGDIDFSYDGKIKVNSMLSLKKTRAYSKRYRDSFIQFTMNNQMMSLNANMFKSNINLMSKIYLEDKKKLSEVQMSIDFPDIRDAVGIFLGVDLVNSNLKGKAKYKLDLKFDYHRWRVAELRTNLSELEFSKNPINIYYKNKLPEIIVKDGKIQKWDLNVRGRKFYITSVGKGNFYDNYYSTTKLKIDASILEIFNDVVSKANGNIRSKINFGHDGGKDLYEAYITTTNLSVSSSLLPIAFSNTNSLISFRDKIIHVEKIHSQLLNGTMNVNGQVDLNNVIPEINIKYEFNNAGATLLRKSNLVFSGEGSILGKNFPYIIGGDLYIESFVLVNELTDLGLGGSGIELNDIDYLPKNQSELIDQLLNFNLNISTREPVYIKNTLADLGFTGAVRLTGGEKEPKISGKINLAPRNNKVTFKNNEFSFSKGNVFFYERNEISNPELDFQADSSINDYKVAVKLVGPVSDYKLNLSSEPPLAQSDVLSLITFGYTEDLSNDLTDSEKESMTRAGVGSIIFDSFKINETLKNEFGLQVNLGTEISKDEGSYLSKRNAEGADVGKARSATKFEIKKKLNEDTSLSFSSTVGNSSEQKQTFNVNYDIDEKMSLEGVYESISTDNAQTINDDRSIGADVKWRWTFK